LGLFAVVPKTKQPPDSGGKSEELAILTSWFCRVTAYSEVIRPVGALGTWLQFR
jgi:hypothetical protein